MDQRFQDGLAHRRDVGGVIDIDGKVAAPHAFVRQVDDGAGKDGGVRNGNEQSVIGSHAGAEQADAASAGATDGGATGGGDDNVIDAEYVDVDDNNK